MSRKQWISEFLYVRPKFTFIFLVRNSLSKGWSQTRCAKEQITIEVLLQTQPVEITENVFGRSLG